MRSASRSTRTASRPRPPRHGAPAPRRSILGVFAHPDDETSGAGGTFTKYARLGVRVAVATATRGEQGHLGTGGLAIAREDLPTVRERELRSVLRLYGARPPVLLGYRDQEVKDAGFEEIVGRVLAAMAKARPDIVITFGPTGISGHDDHIAVHRATVEAFHRYRRSRPQRDESSPRLFYVAIPKDLAKRFGLDLDGPETEPHVIVDISDTAAVKVRALRTYRSQEDAQRLAGLFEQRAPKIEAFHQAYPAAPNGQVRGGFWDEDTA